ncbi:MAG: hypothetical protein F2663_07375 [Actinobacteria bacterium]|uniref:Unannotated protein n=1 Tax=freshwater metagenome TaxID=449393 RepID=A0A6J6PX57_9ZZZZ|nr:hypothetical protein [Actinomycetota bacterium]
MSRQLALTHARTLGTELSRSPGYVIPTLLFPLGFYAAFGLQVRSGDVRAVAVSFAGFAAIGVALFQFGVGIAAERASPWEAVMRALPVDATTRLSARAIVAAVFATGAALPVVALAVAVKHPHIPVVGWIAVATALILGSAPFAALGFAIGHAVPPRTALPITNVIYLAIAYLGGMWSTPGTLPTIVSSIAPYMPTHAFRDTLVAAAAGQQPPPTAVGLLVLYTAFFAALAAAAAATDELRRHA